jgi:DeoR family transcriptional regulator of aga operon
MTQIMDVLAERDAAGIDDLARELGVSTSTIRRDLAVLADQKLLTRVHGGAELADTRQELPIHLRISAQEAKRAIAREVIKLIPRHPYAVGIGGGSTAVTVARALALAGYDQLRIVTNSLTVGQLITAYPEINVIMTGGILRPESLELVGILAENTFKAVNLGAAILGADGITADSVTTHDETEARTNRAMASAAQRVIVVVDSSKIGRTTMATMCPIDQVDVLVTDTDADLRALEKIRKAGVEVILAKA